MWVMGDRPESLLSQQVRRIRQDRRLTQDRLAERSGLSVDAIRRLERGAFSPSLRTLTKLSTGLGVSLSTLFGSVEDDRADVSEICDLVARLSPSDVALARRVLYAIFQPPLGETKAKGRAMHRGHMDGRRRLPT